MIHIANIRTENESDFPADTAHVYIGRRMPGRAPSPLGNPFKLEHGESREDCLNRYRAWLAATPRLQSEVTRAAAIRGELLRIAALSVAGDVVLWCWCAPESCHGDVEMNLDALHGGGMNEVYAFQVSVAGTDWTTIINARTAGKAKYQYWLGVRDVWPDVPLTAMRARNLGPPHTSEEFKRNAKYRGIPDIKCGQRVQAGEATGVIVGHNSSANFDVLFDDDSPRYAGQRLNTHPQGIVILVGGRQ